ncbi:putative secreted protein [Rhodopirellula maiorica SM1]|uniref:Putative secreted protein n=1 Tax=Rhodopirellula maiorica SM1 TaxID=1265738 RepID=M5RQ20_9BACT|nr:alpha/beta hydrolase [Rhodopirellula maiorica]EMI21433.1 putative secreted protein [Rhodopirellula maiorica SM1]
MNCLRIQACCGWIVLWLALWNPSIVFADDYKQLPPPGIEIDPQVKNVLATRVDRLDSEVDALADAESDASSWLPDVRVLTRAVRLAVAQDRFYKTSETKDAAKLLDEAERRIAAVKSGTRGMALLGVSVRSSDKPQMVVGGFVSHIDDSVQPYGLVIPAGFKLGTTTPHRLDVWLHGRGDTKTEIPFLTERMNKVGTYAPANTIVLHPFGRHCNAFRFAGETDVYEALQHVERILPIDRDRIAIRGFSMGGAGCWHLAVHDPLQWFAANPGAGFVDSIVYQGWQTNPPFEITPVRQKLLRWYDVLPWVTNLQNTHPVAYSGEVDKQRQAADRVVAAAKEAGFEFPYVIGAKMGHKVDAVSITEIDRQLADVAAQPLPQPRRQIEFVTYTTRYCNADWLSVTGLEEHWSAGKVKAKIAAQDRLVVKTEGVTHLEFDFRKSAWPTVSRDVDLIIDGARFIVPDQNDAPGWQCRLVRGAGEWNIDVSEPNVLRKRPGLQGPIDDAFCDRFLFVLPTRPATHGEVQRWVNREQQYAQQRWRELMRGDVRVVKDVDLTEDQIKNNHLVCFGDFFSNRYLARIRRELPIEWTKEKITVGDKTFNPATHAVALCYPNPKNRTKYVVVNSGMTFREFSNVSNSRQIAMLPDWAVINVQAEDDSIFPGKIEAEGFFNESWGL